MESDVRGCLIELMYSCSGEITLKYFFSNHPYAKNYIKDQIAYKK